MICLQGVICSHSSANTYEIWLCSFLGPNVYQLRRSDCIGVLIFTGMRRLLFWFVCLFVSSITEKQVQFSWHYVPGRRLGQGGTHYMLEQMHKWLFPFVNIVRYSSRLKYIALKTMKLFDMFRFLCCIFPTISGDPCVCWSRRKYYFRPSNKAAFSRFQK